MLLVFMVEEESAAKVLHTLLPAIVPAGVRVQVLKHRGNRDLRKSLPNKLRNWGIPDTKFVVLHDQDGRDCRELKNELRQLCTTAGRPDALVRIVCQELESWYFGDTAALAAAYGERAVRSIEGKARYRAPDGISKPSRELERLIKAFQKGSAAERVSPHMRLDQNRSTSFQQFVQGVRRICEAGN